MRVVSYWPESDRSVAIHAVLKPSLALYRIPRSLLNAFLIPIARLIKRPDHTVLHVSFNEIEALLVVDVCERALFDEIVAMHTPHGSGLNNFNVETEAKLALANTEAIPKLTAPCLDRVIASPATWCLFAVDYSHFSNVTARQLTQLLRQVTIPFVYSAGHNMEYIWVPETSSHRVLDILNSANWKEQAKTRPREAPLMQYSMSFAPPITPESLPPPGFVNRRSKRLPPPPKVIPSIRILPHSFISHGLNDLQSDWREKIAKLLTRGASLLRERSSVKSTTSTTTPPIIRLPPIPFRKGHAHRPSVPQYTPPSPRGSVQIPTGHRLHTSGASPINRRRSSVSVACEDQLTYRSAHAPFHTRPVALHTSSRELSLLSQRLAIMSLHKPPPLRSTAAPAATTLFSASANDSPSHLHSSPTFLLPSASSSRSPSRPTTPILDFDSNPFFSYTELGPFPHNASTREVNFTARGRLVGHLFHERELSGSMYIVTSEDDFEERYKEHHHEGAMEIPKYYPRRDEGECPDYKCLRIDFKGFSEDAAIDLTCQYSQLLADRDIEHSRISTPSTACFLVLRDEAVRARNLIQQHSSTR